MRIRRVTGAISVAVLTLLTLTAAPANAAVSGGNYTGMGNCPTGSALMRNPTHLQVGCVYSVTRGGSVTIGTTAVQLTSPITLQFGVYWPSNAPIVEFPDGTTANVYSVVPPSRGRLLTTAPLEVPIPGLGNLIPGVTTVFVQVELAGPVTNFVPLAVGQPHPAFVMPVRFRLLNALFGLTCFIGSERNPILLRPTTGTTSPPPPAEPITGDPGVIDIQPDPNGFETIAFSFAGATLVDNTLSVPRANGCGLFGILDPIINSVFGIPTAPGRNAVIFSQTNTSLAISPNIGDLTQALAASSR
jgi:hypothetical protein